MSCGAKYAIPDERVSRAGASGLRVRCTRCRAIMGVSSPVPPNSSGTSSSTSSSTSSGASPKTTKPKRARDVDDGAHRPLTTGVWKNPFADVAAPATLAASGELQHAAGVSREVTGIFAGILANAEAPDLPSVSSNAGARKRVWFCAIDGRARGPYSADEMLALAQKGKVRPSSLIWRPGAQGWKPLRDVDAFDVAWLLDAARQRRAAEQRAEQDLLRRRGIVPVRLERRTVRTSSTTAKTSTTAHEGALAAATFDVDDGPGALPVVGAFTDGDDAGGHPFVWRAPGSASHAALRRPSRWSTRWSTRSRRAIAALAVVAFGALSAGALIAAGALPLP